MLDLINKELLISSTKNLPVILDMANNIDGAVNALINILNKKKIKRLFVTNEDFPCKLAASVSQYCKVELVKRSNIQNNLKESLLQCDASLTGASFVVANSGTIILKSASGQERSCSLIPPVHITVIDGENIVSELKDLFAKQDFFSDSSNFVFVTGPSKTADIEKVIVKGVHGPLEEYLIILQKE